MIIIIIHYSNSMVIYHNGNSILIRLSIKLLVAGSKLNIQLLLLTVKTNDKG